VGLVESLRQHHCADEAESRDRDRIVAFLARYTNPFDRRIAEGHLTASALVVSASGDRVLLLHHRKLDRWLQPGGHAEPGETTAETIALREAREETGVEGLVLHPTAPRPLDVDVHAIPARHEEPAHQHLDLRFLVLAPDRAAVVLNADESHAVRWFEWAELGALHLDPGLVRALAKARAVFPAARP
jgi:8-oxo-dGTP pyrophosphatase MutT (NUDIX family)